MNLLSENPPLVYVIVAVAALVASTVAAVAGTGGAIVLLPVLVAVFGVRDAVPAYTLAQFFGNSSRVAMNRANINFRVVLWFTIGAVPMAIVGAMIFARANDTLLLRILGAFLLVAVAWRRLFVVDTRRFPVQGFAPVGGVFALFSALAGSGGPIVAPFFLAHGLTRGAYIGTEALSSAIMHVVKMTSYGLTGNFSGRAVLIGATLGPLMVVGAGVGKRLVNRMPGGVFIAVVEVVLVAMGLMFLLRG